MKKKLFLMAGISLFGAHIILAQQGTTIRRTCASPAPDAAWDQWFNERVEEYKLKHENDKTEATYTIPVIVHIIHGGTAVGVGNNISAAQVQSQINILNNDYGGTGAGTIPTVFQAAKAGNTGIQFCLALKGPTGTTLTEPGIERINFTTKGWADPGTQNSSNALQSLFDNTIKPASIWDPAKYLNLWVCDAYNSGLLGYASFPSGTGLTGLTPPESAQNCGVVITNDAFGSVGTVLAPYNGGRTATHEIGHWLGLRHIWGDATCATDYCNDTPPQQKDNAGCPTHPYHLGTCSGNTTGEMFMNFMDYTNDACMSLFSSDQKTRLQTAMANGTYRKLLGTHSLCSPTGTESVDLLNNSVALFPNPANGNFNIDFTMQQPADLTIKILNTLGQVVLTRSEKAVTTKRINIDLAAYPKGMYIITIGDERSLLSKKILID